MSINNIFKAVFIAVMMFSSWSVSAGTNNYAGTYSVSKYNTGFSERAMQSTSTHMCFLSRVGVEETDKNREKSTCTVYSRYGFWRLQANVGSKGDNDVDCSAICYTR